MEMLWMHITKDEEMETLIEVKVLFGEEGGRHCVESWFDNDIEAGRQRKQMLEQKYSGQAVPFKIKLVPHIF
jgi:hypothetical protein